MSEEIQHLDMDETSEDETEHLLVELPSSELGPDEGLRLQLLMISKDILLGKAAMKWETHKQYSDVEGSEIIDEAQRMFKFVKG